MNPALKATSVRDLKDAARAINFVLKHKIKGKESIASLCDLLEFTARAVREQSVGSETNQCCICGYLYGGHGHNASPVAEGRCCDTCNGTKVIPARLDQLQGFTGLRFHG